MRSERHGIHSRYIRHRLCNMLLTQSLQKFLQNMMVRRVGSSTLMPWKSGATWQRWKQEEEVRRSQPVYRVEQNYSKNDLIGNDCATQRRELSASGYNATILRQGSSVCVSLSIFPNVALQQRTNRSSTLDGEVQDCETKGSGRVAWCYDTETNRRWSSCNRTSWASSSSSPRTTSCRSSTSLGWSTCQSCSTSRGYSTTRRHWRHEAGSYWDSLECEQES